MRYIVFGYDGRNTLGQIRSLGVKSVRPAIIIVGPRKGLCKASRYCGSIHYVMNESEGIDLLLSKYANSQDKAVVYTDSDGVVGAMNACYDSLSPYFYFSNAGEEGRINKYLEKYNQIQLAKEVGFDVADTLVWNEGDSLPTINYPVFTKAVSSLTNGWKKVAHLCNNAAELNQVLTYGGVNSVIIQQFISKKDEWHFEGFSINRGEDVYIPLYGGYYRLESTSYGTYEWLASYVLGTEFLNKLKNLFRKISYEGIFEVEFILDKSDKLYFTEINFRETAFNHIHTLMGVNLTWMYADSIEKRYICDYEAKIVKDPFVFMNEFADFRRCVVNGKTSIGQWLRDVRTCDAFIYYDRRDWKPFLHECGEFMKRIINAFVNRILGKKGSPG